MPSRKSQKVIIWGGKKGTKNEGKFFVMMKRTGFHDVWIGNSHFYYDEQEQYNSVDEIDMKAAFNPDRRTTTKKGKIVVKKKSK